MEIIKSYTDFSQSKTLSKILPLESADMYFEKGIGDNYKVSFGNCADMRIAENILGIKTIPCWSLAALLNVLSDNGYISTTTSRGSWKIDPVRYLPNIWWCEYEDTKNNIEFNISADNQVDACVKMIMKLHGLNLL